MQQNLLLNVLKKTKKILFWKKKRHSLKTQVIVHKRSKRIVCLATSNGKKDDFEIQKNLLTAYDKLQNRTISSNRVLNEYEIMIKLLVFLNSINKQI